MQNKIMMNIDISAPVCVQPLLKNFSTRHAWAVLNDAPLCLTCKPMPPHRE
jgi:hypothetical protein